MTPLSVSDPPLSPDGRCVVCHGPRNQGGQRRYGMNDRDTDPFCSTACCRKWYGTTLPPPGQRT